MVVPALMEYYMEQRPANKGNVQLRACSGAKPVRTQSEARNSYGYGGPKSAERNPKAKSRPEQPPNHESDQQPVRNDSCFEAGSFKGKCGTLEKDMKEKSRKTDGQSEVVRMTCKRMRYALNNQW